MMIEEIPYEERGEKGILVTMSKDDYKMLVLTEFGKGWGAAMVGVAIGSIIGMIL